MKLQNTLVTAAIFLVLGSATPVTAGVSQENTPQAGLPLVEQVDDGFFVTPPAVANLTVLIVRVYNSNGERVLYARSQGEPVELRAAELPDGEYHYRIKTLLLLDSLDVHGQRQEISRLESGSFIINGNQLQQPPAADEQAGLLEILQNTALQLVGRVAGAFVTPVHAQNISITSSGSPTEIRELNMIDTDLNAFPQWRLYSSQDTVAGFYFALSNFQYFAQRVMYIENGDIHNSVFVDNNGDMHLANGAMFIDRSSQRVAIGGQETPSTLNLWSFQPAIRFHDLLDTKEADLSFDTNAFRLMTRPDDQVAFTTPFFVHGDAPTNALVIQADTVRMGANFFYDAPGRLHIGDAVNNNATTKNLQLSSTNAPEINLLKPGDQGMEMQLFNNEFRFNADSNGNGLNNTSGLAAFSIAAPANSLVLRPDGDVSLGDNFYFDAIGTLNLGDGVNSGNAGSKTLQLTSSTNPILYFLDPQDTGMQLMPGTSGLQFSGDPDGDGTVNAGSPQIFYIHASAPSNSLRIVAGGDIGVGTAAPQASLHIARNDGSAKLLVEEAAANTAARVLLDLRNNGGTGVRLDNTAAASQWQVTNRFAGLRFTRLGSGVAMELQSTGNLNIAGTLTVMSDRNAKTAIEPLDTQAILARVVALPLSRWEYKNAPGESHIGPMAQDFYAAFQLGDSDTNIAIMDANGVALAAIQALAATDQQMKISSGQAEHAYRQGLAAYHRQYDEIAQLEMALQNQRTLVNQLLQLHNASSLEVSLK